MPARDRPSGDPIAAALAREQDRGMRVGLRVRLALTAVVTVWVMIENGWPAGSFYLPFLAIFALSGTVYLWIARHASLARLWPYLLAASDAALITVVILVGNPWDGLDFPATLRLDFGNEIYFLLLIAGSAFTFSPAVVAWCGIACALAWGIGVGFIATLPDTVLFVSAEQWEGLSNAEKLAFAGDPHLLPVGRLVRQLLVLVLAGLALAILMWRVRRIVYGQAEAARERTNLARYFSPNVVDDLARTDTPLATARTQDVAVLFADIVGFTGLSESLPPDRLIALLRRIHGILARQVFVHGGTLEKFTGDGVMATFGTPAKGDRDAGNALRCAIEMADAVAAERQAGIDRGDPPVDIGVGLHYGPVVLGDIGDENRLEFAVLGDTVNVANRLERLTRDLRTRVVASAETVAAARAEGLDDRAVFDRLLARTGQRLTGRAEPVDVWILKETETA